MEPLTLEQMKKGFEKAKEQTNYARPVVLAVNASEYNFWSKMIEQENEKWKKDHEDGILKSV